MKNITAIVSATLLLITFSATGTNLKVKPSGKQPVIIIPPPSEQQQQAPKAKPKEKKYIVPLERSPSEMQRRQHQRQVPSRVYRF